MPRKRCAGCGNPPTGFAKVNDDWYCHGDDDPTPTCYERASFRFFVERQSIPERFYGDRMNPRGEG